MLYLKLVPVDYVKLRYLTKLSQGNSQKLIDRSNLLTLVSAHNMTDEEIQVLLTVLYLRTINVN